MDFVHKVIISMMLLILNVKEIILLAKIKNTSVK